MLLEERAGGLRSREPRGRPPRRMRTRLLGEVWVNERGQRPSRPLTPRRQWLRGLDLNQRPLGYEGKSALHTDQREPTGTNGDGDLRGERAVPCRFVSVA